MTPEHRHNKSQAAALADQSKMPTSEDAEKCLNGNKGAQTCSYLMAMPTEIVMALVEELVPKDLGSFRQTCKRFLDLCTPILFECIRISIFSCRSGSNRNLKYWDLTTAIIKEGRIFEHTKCIQIVSPRRTPHDPYRYYICRDVAPGLFGCSSISIDRLAHKSFESQVMQLVKKLEKDRLRCFQWEMGFEPPEGVFTYLAAHQKNLTAISIVDLCLHSVLRPCFITAALQGLEIKSFSWIGLQQDMGEDIIPQLAQTQHDSLQDLQLVFSAHPGTHSPRSTILPSWRTRNTKYPFPAFKKLQSLSLSGINLCDMDLQLAEKLNLEVLNRLRVIGCPGDHSILQCFQKLSPRLLTLELELYNDLWGNSHLAIECCAALSRTLCRFTTLNDFKLSLGGSEERIAVALDVEGLSQHHNLRRVSCQGIFGFKDVGLQQPLNDRDMSIRYLSTHMECLALSDCTTAMAEQLSNISNSSLKLVHIREKKPEDSGLYTKEYIDEAISEYNEDCTNVSFEKRSRDYSWDGRDLYCLALDLFRKDSTKFPSLEVLAYGNFLNSAVETYDEYLLFVKDPLVPFGCTMISTSELEARTTVKSPMSFLRAFDKRPATFWV